MFHIAVFAPFVADFEKSLFEARDDFVLFIGTSFLIPRVCNASQNDLLTSA
jgi:hypothetical protein